MGLIKAGIGALGGSLADQWKEFFYCEAIDNEILMVKGQKQISKRSSNTKGNDNIISNGSGIAVADGQCMIIVEQGKVVEVCAEPGEFTYDASTEPSIFTGGLGAGIKNTFKTIGKRFTYGGDTGKDQRVYYFNTKEIIGNLFGTATPVPFRVVDNNIGLDIDVSVRCNGQYSFKIVDPLLFYTSIAGNVKDEYPRSELTKTMKDEFIDSLQPCFATLSAMQIRPNEIIAHNKEMKEIMNTELTKLWGEGRGINIANIAIKSVSLPDEDAQMIKDLQRTAVMRNANMAAATLVGAQADAMKAAAENKNGAMMGFMGMGMAQQAGGMNAQSLFEMGAQQQAQQAAQQAAAPTPAPAQAAPQTANADAWTCECGAANTAKFCSECGKPKPAPAQSGWTCSCGAVNKGKFCCECGKPKPAAEPLYKCDKCGWEPADPKNPPKFCPECGDPFDANDIQ